LNTTLGAIDQGLLRLDALYLHVVGLRQFVVRIGQAMDELAVVGEDEQAFAVVIQPACGVNAFWQAKFTHVRLGGSVSHTSWVNEDSTPYGL
jgi:hypothetical protein